MKITYYGHSCFSVLADNKNILFDPFITPNELASNLNIEEVQADYIFISHAHYDHITDAIRIANITGAKVLGNFEIFNWLNENGIKNTFPINPGGQYDFDFGTVKCVIAQHSSSFSNGRYGGVASGFVLTTKDGNFYYSGDSALTLDMQLIRQYTTLDFAVFPIGDLLTMGVKEAIEAANFVGVKDVLGVHYDTFDYIKINHQKAKKDFNESGIKLYMPPIGCSFELKKI